MILHRFCGRPQRKNVHFPVGEKLVETVCIIPSTKHDNEDNKKDEDSNSTSTNEQQSLYYSKEDFERFKLEASADSRIIRRCGCAHYLSATYSNDENNRSLQLERLKSWVLHGNGNDGNPRLSARGMEKICNRKHGALRNDVQWNSIMAVMNEQHEIRMTTMSPQADPERIRRVYEKATRKSREFALNMGHADAYAVSKYMESDITSESFSPDRSEMLPSPAATLRMKRRASFSISRPTLPTKAMQWWSGSSRGLLAEATDAHPTRSDQTCAVVDPKIPKKVCRRLSLSF